MLQNRSMSFFKEQTMRYAKIALLLLLLGCSADKKKEIQDTAPFTSAEADYIKMLFWGPRAGSMPARNDPTKDIESNDIKKLLLNPHLKSGWQDYESPVLRAMKPAVNESFRSHSKEVLPILISGWENGWKNYPWKSSDLPPFWLLKNNRNLLDLIICLDPEEAEKMLVKAFNPEPFQKNSQARLDEREEILIVLYWKLHSNRWKPLLKPLAERGERDYTRLYVVWCAQENDKDGLEQAETLLKKKSQDSSRDKLAEYQSYVYQLKGDVEGLKALCKQYHSNERDNSGLMYPLWSLSFMKRDDILSDYANGPYEPELKKVAKSILIRARKWREIRNTNPCEVEMKGLQGFGTSDTIALSRFGGGGGPRI
jgi:hypothetical protein